MMTKLAPFSACITIPDGVKSKIFRLKQAAHDRFITFLRARQHKGQLGRSSHGQTPAKAHLEKGG